jgi:serine/threonine-protein kinase
VNPHAADDRFTLGKELGRGGLGRVVEAAERDLGRTVALKLLRDDIPPQLEERFIREARLTARLEHPNIVPVHEFATVAGEGGLRRLMLSMKRVQGRDLGQLLRAVMERRVPEWSLHRLLGVFQDVCQGIAFAHAQGVIHRDLKPANVMIGDYGEVLIVDWGLAKESAVPEEKAGRAKIAAAALVSSVAETVVPRDLDESGITMDGAVVGTPAYMSPEAADGRVADVDELSDVYSLGAILYEILTFAPPVDGDTLEAVLDQVKAGVRVPPSRRLRASCPDAPPLAPELDVICLKALAPRKEDRYPSAKALHADIQLFLEGVKERERNRRLANDAVRRARRHMDEQERLQRKAGAAERALRLDERRLGPRADRSSFWRAQDRLAELVRQEARAYADAVGELIGALNYDRTHAEGRRMMAELHWRKFLEAEAADDRRAIEIHRRAVEQFNDGAFDLQLRGDGTLKVRVAAFGCECLERGRKVAPAEFRRFGYDAASGRALDGRAQGEGVPALEPEGAVRLRWHAAGCRTTPVEGARVWAWRFEERDRRLVPVTPSLSDLPARRGARRSKSPPLPRLFSPDAPCRPAGPGWFLGATPLDPVEIPMGSWLLVVDADGYEPVRCPVTIPRCGAWSQEITLVRPSESPEGFVPVPAGPFESQGDPGNPFALPADARTLPDFFVQRHPVTCRQYAAFLNALPPEEAAARAPRLAPYSGAYWPGPPFAVATADWLRHASPELRARARRPQKSAADWEEDWPVVGITWDDAMAYAAWRRAREGIACFLPHELEWEKAARGPDRRHFPWGRAFDERWCNTARSLEDGPHLAGVKLFPEDESPYGARGFAGNAADWCLNDPGPEQPGRRAVRGGDYTDAGAAARLCSRRSESVRAVADTIGFRLVVPLRAEGNR